MVWSQQCSCCGETKSVSEFAHDPNRMDGATRCCKECRGTDEDETVFSIAIETRGKSELGRRGIQVTRGCIENLDTAYLVGSLQALVNRESLSEKQLFLLFKFGQMLVEAREQMRPDCLNE